MQDIALFMDFFCLMQSHCWITIEQSRWLLRWHCLEINLGNGCVPGCPSTTLPLAIPREC